MSLYLADLGVWSKELGIVFTVFAIGGAVSPFPAGKLADKLGKLAVLKGCAFLLLLTTFSFNFFSNYLAICFLTLWSVWLPVPCTRLPFHISQTLSHRTKWVWQMRHLVSSTDSGVSQGP